MNPYDYSPVNPRFNLHFNKTTRDWWRYTVDFPVAQPTCYVENNTARGEYFQPRRDGNGMLAILLHGWGDRSAIPCRLLARALVRKGIACFILYTAFHSSRMPEEIKNKRSKLTSEDWFEGYRVSVIDVRQIVDWAASRDEINEGQIAVIGISLGGFIAAISMGVDRRISAGVFLLAGGNYENPVWTRKKQENGKEAENLEALNQYRRYLAEVAERGFASVIPVKKSYLTDPMTFAGYIRERPVMMLNALRDEMIPKQATLDLWQAYGEPEIKWYPTGHASLWLLYPFVRKRIADFLGSTFKSSVKL